MPVVCGEYNAKNGYGAYVGFSKFIYEVNTSELRDTGDSDGFKKELANNIYVNFCP